MTRAYIAVGSNIAPARNVLAALRSLAQREQVVAVSTVYETPAEERPEQPPYYNCVVEIETATPPVSLKSDVLRSIESALGRRRETDKFASRTIDLDLVWYGDLALGGPELTLPDPQAMSRAFVARPLLELAPGLRLPGSGRPLAEIAAALPDGGMRPLRAYTRRIQRLGALRHVSEEVDRK